MELKTVFQILAVSLAAIIAIAYLAAKGIAAKRRLALRSVAQRLALEYFPYGLPSQSASGAFEDILGRSGSTPKMGFLHIFRGFFPFSEGHSPEFSCVMLGRRGDIEWLVFDFTYLITNDRDRDTTTTTHHAGIAIGRAPVDLPVMTITPEGLMDRIREMFRAQEVKFDDPEFDRRHYVQCANHAAARGLLSPELRSLMLTMPPHQWQIAGPFVVIAKPHHLDAEDAYRMLADIEAFLGRAKV